MRRGSEQTTDQILVRELARLAPPLGGWAVRLAAKSLSTETQSETFVLKIPLEQAQRLAHLTLTKLGRIEVSNNASVASVLRAVIGAGSLNLNPAVVDLVITGTGGAECSVAITAAAKEGRVKQQTASKAIQRVTEALLESPVKIKDF
jgi:hypothetical protein